MSQLGDIIAIGGGGFGRNPNSRVIEQYILDQTSISNPKICFIPTASAEDKGYIVNFYKSFSKLDCEPTHLNLFERTPNLRSIINKQDIIFVGGGNTKSMLAVWKEWKLDILLKKFYSNGKILCGVSAGSICWFDQGVTDSWASNLSIINCLGFIKGNNCPHYDGEKDRRPSVHQFVKDKKLNFCYASDDGAAIHFKNGEIYKSISFYRNAKSYIVRMDSKDAVIEEEIPGIAII